MRITSSGSTSVGSELLPEAGGALLLFGGTVDVTGALIAGVCVEAAGAGALAFVGADGVASGVGIVSARRGRCAVLVTGGRDGVCFAGVALVRRPDWAKRNAGAKLTPASSAKQSDPHSNLARPLTARRNFRRAKRWRLAAARCSCAEVCRARCSIPLMRVRLAVDGAHACVVCVACVLRRAVRAARK